MHLHPCDPPSGDNEPLCCRFSLAAALLSAMRQCVFLQFYMNGVIRYVLLFVWLLPLRLRLFLLLYSQSVPFYRCVVSCPMGVHKLLIHLPPGVTWGVFALGLFQRKLL